MILIWITMAAHASELQLRSEVPRPLAGHAVFDLRVGMDLGSPSEGSPLPIVCAEGMPHRRWSLEACGNGSGILHQGDEPDMAHFRVRGAPILVSDGRWAGQLMLGVGFAEVQRSADQPGFRFGDAQTGQVEAAGPEASLGVKGRFWVTEQSHIAMDVIAGTAYIPGAPEVMGWQSPVVPFVSLTTGMGF